MTRNPEFPAYFGELFTRIKNTALTDPDLAHVTFELPPLSHDTIVLKNNVPAIRVKVLSAVTEVMKRLLHPEYRNIAWRWMGVERTVAVIEAEPVWGGPLRYVKFLFDEAWKDLIDLDILATELNRILLPQHGIGVSRERDYILLTQQTPQPILKEAAMEWFTSALNSLGEEKYSWRWKDSATKKSAWISYQGVWNLLFHVRLHYLWRQRSELKTACDVCGEESSELIESEDSGVMLCSQCGIACGGCDRWVDRDNMRQTVDGKRCELCLEDYTLCARCSSLVQADDAMSVGDENWCNYCYENHTFYCDSCSTSYSTDVNHFTVQPNDATICEDCYNEGGYFSCDGCSESWHEDDLGGTDEGEAYCTDCWADRQAEQEEEEEEEEEERPSAAPPRPSAARSVPSSLRGYHSHSRRWNRFGRAARGIWYGIELEAIKKPLGSDFMPVAKHIEQNYGRVDGKEFLFTERDGSLKLNPQDQSEPVKGFETIFHPMSPEFIKENQELLGKVLKDMRSRDMVSYEGPKLGISTGMHVTFTYSSLSDLEKAKFLMLIFENKQLMLTISRRKKKHIDRYARLDAPYPIPQMVRQKLGYEAKYVAVNLKRSDEQAQGGYVELAEVRIFRGTLHLGAFLMNIELVMACVEFARSLRYGLQECTAENLLAYIASHRKVYPFIFTWLKKKALV